MIKALRATLIALLVLVVGIPVISYLMLSTDWAQRRLRQAGEEAVCRLLGSDVSIGSVSFQPFNRISLHSLALCDDNGDTCLRIGTVMARMEIADLLINRRIIVDYAVIDSLDARISKASPDSPLNIQGIINRFKKNDEKKEQKVFALRLNNIEISNSRLAYDVLSAEEAQPGAFDPNHIAIDSLNVEVYAPVVSTWGYALQLRHFAFAERSGFRLSDLQADLLLTPEILKVDGLQLSLPHSMLEFSEIRAALPNGYGSVGKIGTSLPDSVEILPQSHIYLPDLKAFFPPLGAADATFDVDMKAKGMLRDFEIESLSLLEQRGLASVNITGRVTGLPSIDSAKVDNLAFSIIASPLVSQRAMGLAKEKVKKPVQEMLLRAGTVDVKGNFSGSMAAGTCAVTLATSQGGAYATGNYKKIGKAVHFDALASLNDLDLGSILGNSALGAVEGVLKADGQILKGKVAGVADATFDKLQFKGYSYKGIGVNVSATDASASAAVKSTDPNMRFDVNATLSGLYAGRKHLVLDADIRHADLNSVNLWRRFPDHAFSTKIQADASASSLADFDGSLSINDIKYVDKEGNGLRLAAVDIEADNGEDFDEIRIASPALNGSIQGRYDFATVAADCQSILAEVYPGLVPAPEEWKVAANPNLFAFDFTVDDSENISRFFGLPVYNIDPLQITGWVDEDKRQICVGVDAEWLFNGGKLIRNTYLGLSIDGSAHESSLYATSFIPTQKGPMNLIASIQGADGLLQTDIDWEIVRDIPINGQIEFSTLFTRSAEGKLNTLVDFAPGEITFGNEVWNIQPSSIFYADKLLIVNDFCLQAPTQAVKISGTASEQASDVLSVDIDNVNLIDIFETLGIDNALLCGQATGQVWVSSLFTKTPDIRSTKFSVKNIGYNRCIIGDADIDLGFDVDNVNFWFEAVIMQEDGRQSTIQGSIYPATEGIDLRFNADHVKVGFMQPFMQAFCSGIEGYATGDAHLFGTFKYIDMESDHLVADSLRLKIDFTNTWYSVVDAPLEISPGIINIPPVDIYDEKGNSAKLSGWVKHVFFKEPSFDFDVRDARDFLCYDMARSDEFRWWGTVYGNGGAHVDGVPGVVNIGVNMATQAGSHFTFELSDAEVAEEYSFITFRDATPERVVDNFYEMKVESLSENRREASENSAHEDSPTAYNMNIQVDITPQAEVVLVMDPVAGDEIKAHGSGQMRMYYGSKNDELTLNGKYTLESGSYNFTLQDIIIKPFRINKGSTIQFDGDPYAAKLNIEAIYEVHANLSDLDKSFLSDHEVKNTKVKVYAVLKVTGNMLQPDISFDLDFPNFDEDVKRKVQAIVSTEDMMNRQIIYLLALNRFYTPDYMASTTKGNELFSVASSTLSSQLSSMLGKLSDNWSIAPNLRSDRGDFSDVEVDVNLSSRLLNNRLLFNGNFGYRDKSLNTNQFVGDFDVEYLLNKTGTLRLKAYNRYNDQNYYLRTAQTTQGIGVMARRDFDGLSEFFGRKKRKPQQAVPVQIELQDTTAIVVPDSITIDIPIITPNNQ